MNVLAHVLIVLVALVVRAVASMWEDPEFEAMAAGVELIAIVEITDGGAFECRARTVDIIKGEKPEGDDFNLRGYNNHQGSDEWIEAETLKTGDRLLVFLRQFVPDPLVERGEEHSAFFGPSETEPYWYVPTPTCGDLRIRGEMLHGGWYSTTSPEGDAGIPLPLGVALIRGLVLHQEGKVPEAGRVAIAQHLTKEVLDRCSENRDQEDAYGLSNTILWMLCAQGAYGDESMADLVFHAVESKDAGVAVGAGRALLSLPESDAGLHAVGKLLANEHSYAQAGACRALLKWKVDGSTAAKLILPRLENSDPRGQSPQNIMESVRNVYASGREMMIRVLTESGAGDLPGVENGVAALVKEQGLSAEVLRALGDHFLKYPSEVARERFLELYERCPGAVVSLFNYYVLTEGGEATRKAAAAKIFDSQLSSNERESAFGEFCEKVPVDQPIVLHTVNEVLEKFPDESDLKRIAVATLLKHGGEEEELLAEATLLRIDPEDEYAFSRAVESAVKYFPEGSPALARIAEVGLGKDSGDSAEELWIATAKAGGEEMLALLKEQDPERRPELHSLLLDFFELKANPISDSKKHIDAWIGLIERERGLGWAAEILYSNCERVATENLDYARVAVRKTMDTSDNIKLLILLKKIGDDLTPEERDITEALER